MEPESKLTITNPRTNPKLPQPVDFYVGDVFIGKEGLSPKRELLFIVTSASNENDPRFVALYSRGPSGALYTYNELDPNFYQPVKEIEFKVALR